MQQRSLITRFGLVLKVKVVLSSSKICFDGIPYNTRIRERTRSFSLMVLEEPGTLMTLPTLALKHVLNDASF